MHGETPEWHTILRKICIAESLQLDASMHVYLCGM